MFKGVFLEATEVLLSSLEQSQRYLTQALEGLTQEESAWSPGDECNSIGFREYFGNNDRIFNLI